MKKHVLDGGLEVITFSPPAGFDPLTASEHDRRRFGFPALPRSPALRNRYEQTWQRMKGKFRYIHPNLQVRHDMTFGRPAPAPADDVAGPRWSGVGITNQAQHPIRTVHGDWVVPNIDPPTQGKWYYAGFWIGIDDSQTPIVPQDLLQAGVGCQVIRNGSSLVRQYYAFFEWVPAPPVIVSNLPVEPGDRVTVLICALPPPGGGAVTSASIVIMNRTSGASTSLTVVAPPGVSVAGFSAEWIAEAPVFAGQQTEIPDYGEVFFSDCWAATEQTTLFPNAEDGLIYNLQTNQGTISVGTPVGSHIVQCEYVAAAPVP